jgi:protein-S-isoprenylcysteine O-methyltransferase Ste14
MSRATQLMLGLSLIAVPTVIYGGLTVLGVVTGGAYGAPAPPNLTGTQQAFYRAGHAHAGVLLILSLILQMLIDHAGMGSLEWPVRVAAPAAAILVSAGFFGLAHLPALRGVLYTGAALMAASTLAVGVGLLRAR